MMLNFVHLIGNFPLISHMHDQRVYTNKHCYVSHVSIDKIIDKEETKERR